MEQRTFIRRLRNPTLAERKLGQHLSARQLAGIRCNRHVKIEPDAGDLAARSAGVAIELDGDSHVMTGQKDAARTRFMESRGYVLRFSNAKFMTNVEGVAAEIERVPARLASPSPSRKREGNAPSSSLPLAGRVGRGQTHTPE